MTPQPQAVSANVAPAAASVASEKQHTANLPGEEADNEILVSLRLRHDDGCRTPTQAEYNLKKGGPSRCNNTIKVGADPDHESIEAGIIINLADVNMKGLMSAIMHVIERESKLSAPFQGFITDDEIEITHLSIKLNSAPDFFFDMKNVSRVDDQVLRECLGKLRHQQGHICVVWEF